MPDAWGLDGVARHPDKFVPCYLNEEDVPGAKFVHTEVKKHTIDQLKRWLQCRGLSQSGNKDELVERCTSALANNRRNLIDVSIDGGKWHNLKRDATYQNLPESCRPPIVPIFGWKVFPGNDIPEGFSKGQIISYMVERHPTCLPEEVDSDGDMPAAVDMDVGTAKPLKRGQQYVKSGHVTEVNDSVTSTHHFIRAIIYSSFHKDRVYRVYVTMSKTTAYIVEGLCECRQRALGRCSHVAALQIFVLDHVRKKGYQAITCTSRPQAWGLGTLKRKPKKVRESEYASRKSLKEKSHSDPRATRDINRMTPEQRRNYIAVGLQQFTMPSGWETLMSPFYEDFPVDEEYSEYIGQLCCMFLQCLDENAVGKGLPCFPVTASQSENDDWNQLRCWMVTASRAKKTLGMQSLNALYNYLRQDLWQMESRVVTVAMEYGIESEPLAREKYLEIIRKEDSEAVVNCTGLWALTAHPQLGCSPDGIVVDKRGVRLLEIKCPYVVKDCDPNDFKKALTSSQLGNFCLKMDGQKAVLKQSHEFYSQIQMCLGIHDLPVCDFFVWSEHGYVLLEIVANKDLWDDMRLRLIEKHATMILPEYFAKRVVRSLDPMVLPKKYIPYLYPENRSPSPAFEEVMCDEFCSYASSPEPSEMDVDS